MSPSKSLAGRAPASVLVPVESDLPAYLGLGWLARETIPRHPGKLHANYTWRDELVYRGPAAEAGH